MKAALAVLAASFLFFVGVLTGAGRREAVPPPPAIPLGVLTPAGSAGSPGLSGTPGTPATNSPARPALRSGASTGPGPTTPATAAPAATPPATASPAPPGAGGPPGAGAPGATTTTAPAASTTTTRPGHVEHVDNQVDCSSAGRRGKAQRQPCPSSTTSPGGPGGGPH
ncbi:MAG TPA: hypothetical protein VFE55_14805 [Acidimicrobiia bacterium]|nr:hypothetical protein [Acidimicrobiia bacterium]